MGLRLVPTSMTSNDLEQRNSYYFAFSPNWIALLAKYVTLVEYIPTCIMSINIVSQFQSSTFGFWPQLTHPAVWSVCDS